MHMLFYMSSTNMTKHIGGHTLQFSVICFVQLCNFISALSPYFLLS